jgi:hypothetical protein
MIERPLERLKKMEGKGYSNSSIDKQNKNYHEQK